MRWVNWTPNLSVPPCWASSPQIMEKYVLLKPPVWGCYKPGLPSRGSEMLVGRPCARGNGE